MLYFAHAGHEHTSEVNYTGLIIIVFVAVLLLIISISGFYLKNRKKDNVKK